MKQNQKHRNKNNLIDIKKMDDPLSELKEVEEKEIGEKKLTDISKEINNKKEEKKEGDEDEDSDKDSVENLLEEQKEKEIDLNKIKIDEMQINISTSDKLSLKTTMRVKADVLKKSLNDPDYFVSFPVLKPYKIPGYESKQRKEEEKKKEEEGKVEILENGGKDKLEKIEEVKEEIKPPEQMEKSN